MGRIASHKPCRHDKNTTSSQRHQANPPPPPLRSHLISWTEGLLHGMQPIGHGVNGIDDEAHLGVLCVLLAQRLPPCEEHSPV